ncbi:MAG: N4-gp56 family major capsid protein [Desulfobacteraceae bacterium 4572_19]|nr:MAG: N4-gp56 family major capsid protein [Desulfobacteraceae bacterium 4572_19]
MGQTVIGLNDPKAIRKQSAFLAVDVPKQSYWNRKFVGSGEGSSMPIQRLTDLESDAGEFVSYDLSMQLKMQPVEGDEVLEGKEEGLKFYTDGVFIDQMRGGVDSGGRMTRKRTIHDLRKIGRKRQSEWWARVFDEMHFMYASGTRGNNTGWVFPTTYTGFGNNPLTPPDTDHYRVANAKTKATLTASDKLTLSDVDKMYTHAQMMGGGTEEKPQIEPIKINGEDHYVLIMNPWQEYDIRHAAGETEWLAIQKAAAGAEGKKSPIFKGGLGMYNNVVFHKHKDVVRFSDYGASGDVQAARALFLGEQAMVIAFGLKGSGLRFDWNEETRDNGNKVVISTHTIFGMKKVTFNGLDYGMMALDTAAAEPV